MLGCDYNNYKENKFFLFNFEKLMNIMIRNLDLLKERLRSLYWRKKDYEGNCVI